uniref:Potassium channel toxin alpha-KTx 6.8 n=1 Tax=Opistophthalmus carinatus TaxID=190115 RepID=KAX68_OPICA|nr:RecName: Full=Potassium channel toxin alpha-KTx 6.8; AltName: Full=OcKTx3; Flags: Precursor [Opistophthalmus carinatus]AAP73819.1 potassium channel toxin KTx3 [Opistophthalmus carinatus]
MNAKFILLLLVVTTTILLPDTQGAEVIKCRTPKDCADPCRKQTGCPHAKCMNKTCRCHRCG